MAAAGVCAACGVVPAAAALALPIATATGDAKYWEAEGTVAAAAAAMEAVAAAGAAATAPKMGPAAAHPRTAANQIIVSSGFRRIKSGEWGAYLRPHQQGASSSP